MMEISFYSEKCEEYKTVRGDYFEHYDRMFDGKACSGWAVYFSGMMTYDFDSNYWEFASARTDN